MLHGPVDVGQIILAVIIHLPATIGAIGALIVALRNGKKADRIIANGHHGKRNG